MSHELTDTVHDRYLNNLDVLCMDPIISKVLRKIQLYNELLTDEYVNEDELAEILSEIDQEWYFLLGEEADYVGFASFYNPDDDPEYAEPQRAYHENQNVYFRGVVAKKIDTFTSENDVIDADVPARYRLRIGLEKEGLNSKFEVLSMKGSAAVEDIITLEFLQMMSNERARQWLDNFHPQAIEDIDVALLNPGIEECELTMRLADIAVDISTVGANDSAMGSSKLALGVYTESLFSFDNQIPYMISASGQIWVLNDDGSVISTQIEVGSLAQVYRITWQPASDDEDTVVRPILDVSFLGVDKDVDPVHVLVPINIIKKFVSIRHHYFVGYDDEALNDEV